MKSLSLSQKLTLIFALMLIITSAFTMVIQHKNRTRYSDAMIQNLSYNLASTIAKSDVLIDMHGIASPALDTLFTRMMDYNPSVEVYLLDAHGDVIANAAPPGHLLQKRISLKPVIQLMSGADLPVYGDDPRNPAVKKVFSVTPLTSGKNVLGYLYVILQGEDYEHLQQDAMNSTLRSSMIMSVLVILLCGLITGSFAFYLVTSPVRRLTRQVSVPEEQSHELIERLANTPIPQEYNEVAQLHRAFIDMAKRIAVQWEVLELKEEQRREFVANISHDLRTPLMSIQGYLETLSVKSDSLTNHERRRYLHIALTQSVKVGFLAQQLFELARLENGVITPQIEPFSLPDLIQDVMQKFELDFAQRELQISVELAAGLPMINADMFMFERVLTNLVDNAVRHTPSAGSIHLRVWHNQTQVVMELEDSGPGIPLKQSQTLFERPSISDQNRRDNGGLGLIIVKRMLQLHQGDIELIQAPGACFRFYLPL